MGNSEGGRGGGGEERTGVNCAFSPQHKTIGGTKAREGEDNSKKTKHQQSKNKFIVYCHLGSFMLLTLTGYLHKHQPIWFQPSAGPLQHHLPQNNLQLDWHAAPFTTVTRLSISLDPTDGTGEHKIEVVAMTNTGFIRAAARTVQHYGFFFHVQIQQSQVKEAAGQHKQLHSGISPGLFVVNILLL